MPQARNGFLKHLGKITGAPRNKQGLPELFLGVEYYEIETRHPNSALSRYQLFVAFSGTPVHGDYLPRSRYYIPE